MRKQVAEKGTASSYLHPAVGSSTPLSKDPVIEQNLYASLFFSKAGERRIIENVQVDRLKQELLETTET